MKNYFFGDFLLFQDMNEEELEEIKKVAYQKNYDKNEIIFLEGEKADAVYFVLEGLIKVFRTGKNGREKTLSLLGRGDFFGEMTLLGNDFRSASVQAIKPSQLFIIERDQFKDLISRFPQISLKIIAILSQRLRKANNQIKNLTFKGVKGRFKEVLAELVQKYGKVREEGGVIITKKITHKELANLVGTTRETITKLIGEMVEQNKILVKNRYLILLEIDEEIR